MRGNRVLKVNGYAAVGPVTSVPGVRDVEGSDDLSVTGTVGDQVG